MLHGLHETVKELMQAHMVKRHFDLKFLETNIEVNKRN